jgi:transcriptional regulator GlxA family with amidase domain
MTKNNVLITILCHEGALQSCVYGLKEMFLLANELAEKEPSLPLFSVALLEVTDVSELAGSDLSQIIIIPPALDLTCYLRPSLALKRWLISQHKRGTIISSVCSGVFLLAATGLLQGRTVTTHWNLERDFAQHYPEITLDVNRILIHDGDIITAGGLMAWVDLGLELVALIMHPSVMQQLGSRLVVDTGRREQRYYQRFSPTLTHKDQSILTAQHYLQEHLGQLLQIKTLSSLVYLTERTFLRRFVKATGHKPLQYLQCLRVQKACDSLELTDISVDEISYSVGYENSSAFGRVFLDRMGLTPSAFRSRFSRGSFLLE